MDANWKLYRYSERKRSNLNGYIFCIRSRNNICVINYRAIQEYQFARGFTKTVNMNDLNNNDLNNNDVYNNVDWKHYIRKMTRTKKIERAAIITKDGQVLCCSNDLSVMNNDVVGFNSAFSGNYNSLMKLKLCGNCYTCFRQKDDTNTVVGSSGQEILVLHRCKDLIIVGVGHSDTPGSCIYEVTKFCKRLDSRSLSVRS